MKRLPLLLALAAATAHADLVIEQQIESPMQNGNVTMKVKGDQIRIDMASGPMGSMSMITNVNTGDSTSLIHAQKMAMKVSGAQTKAMMEMMKKQAPAAAETAAPKLEPTGKMEKVGEFNAEIYTWSAGGTTQTLWVAKDFPNFAAFKGELAQLSKSAASGIGKGMQPDMSALPGMVVKSVSETNGMKVTSTLVSAKQEPVDAAAFEAPKDYQTMAQPTMPVAPPAPK